MRADARYRPSPLTAVARGVAYDPFAQQTLALDHEPRLAAFLAEWGDFRTLDGALLDYFRLPNLDRLADQLPRRSGIHPQVLATRFVRTLLRTAQRAQIAAVSRRPLVVRLRAVLDDLVARGVLMSEDDLVQACRCGGADPPAPPITAVGLVIPPTGGDAAARVQEYLASDRAADSALRVIVLDLCRDPDSAKANRRRLAAVREPGSIYYADRARLHAVTTRLLQQGLLGPGAEHALIPSDGWEMSAGLNALLLDTRGELALLTTSDVEERCWRHPSGGHTLAVADGSASTPAQRCAMACSPEVAAQSSAGTRVVAAGVLGSSVRGLIARFSREGRTTRLQAASDELMQAMRTGAATVRLASFGCATPLAGGALEADIADAYTLMHTARRLGACIGVDNRSLSPPFLPLRDADRLFAELTSLMYDDAFLVTVPWAVVSEPAGPPGEAAGAHVPFQDDCAIVSACLGIARGHTVGQAPAHVLRFCGMQLAEACRLSSTELARRLRPCLYDRFGPALTNVEPPSWPTSETRETLHRAARILDGWPRLVAAWDDLKLALGGSVALPLSL
jgi:hypothetical protein